MDWAMRLAMTSTRERLALGFVLELSLNVGLPP